MVLYQQTSHNTITILLERRVRMNALTNLLKQAEDALVSAARSIHAAEQEMKSPKAAHKRLEAAVQKYLELRAALQEKQVALLETLIKASYEAKIVELRHELQAKHGDLLAFSITRCVDGRYRIRGDIQGVTGLHWDARYFVGRFPKDVEYVFKYLFQELEKYAATTSATLNTDSAFLNKFLERMKGVKSKDRGIDEE